jgi:hypothetical protein
MDTDKKQMPPPVAAPARPGYKRCLNCGKVITPGAGQRRDYCNSACKQAAYRKRKQAASVTV